jgi:hypothetical protein
MRPSRRFAGLRSAAQCTLLLASSGVAAAPLDALLSAEPVRLSTARPDSVVWQLELARDLANERLDVLGLRASSTFAGTSIGDYSGQHLRLQARQGRLSGDFGLWKRAIEDRSDTHRLTTWHTAAQWQLNQPGPIDSTPRWAVRIGAWGNQSDRLTRRTSSKLVAGGLDSKLSEVQILQPRDRQTQLDLIASQPWPVSGLTASAFVGLGLSRVSNRGVTGSASVAGCPYALDFGTERLVAQPASGCTDALIISVPNNLLPNNALAESNYRARYAHLGGSLRLERSGWSAAIGYEFAQTWRQDIDTLLRQRGEAGYQRNHILIGELQLDVTDHVSALLRAQYMQHQFLGELPLAYNTQTAARFSQRYGLVSAGLLARF